jgi:hypothetical protein
MTQVLLIRPIVNANVIKNHEHTLMKQWSQCGVHDLLKGCWHPEQPKNHHPKLIMTGMSLKGSLVLLTTSPSRWRI